MSTSLHLRPLQQRFQARLLAAAPGIEAAVVSDDTASAETRLAVYFDAYRLRLVEVLGTDYPALKGVLGEAPFGQMARAYIGAHPSEERSIRWFGRHLSNFLRKAMPFAEQPVLGDIAAFEWRRGEVFDERDGPCVTEAQVAEVPPEAWPQLRLSLNPAMRRLKLEWNAPAICKAVGNHTELPAAERAPGEWLLWRQGLDIYWRSLDAAEAGALDAAAAGASFADVCEGLLRWIATDQAALRAASLLKRWTTDGLIARLHLADSTP